MSIDYLRQDGVRLTGTLARCKDHSRLMMTLRFAVLRTQLIRHSPMVVEALAARPLRRNLGLMPHDVEAIQRLRSDIQREFTGGRKKGGVRRALSASSTPPIITW